MGQNMKGEDRTPIKLPPCVRLI